MAERKGLEPSASGVTGRRYNRLNYRSVHGGQYRTGTWGPRRVKAMLDQLS